MYPILCSPREIIYNPVEAGLSVLVKEKKIVTTINHTAATILAECNGQQTVDEIIDKMVIIYSEEKSKVKNLVNDFLVLSENVGTVTMSIKKENKYKIDVYGSKDYWIPSVISLELTYKCPLFCKHCYREASIEYCHFLELDNIKKIANEMKDLGVMYVQLTGGEPMIHPKFPEIVKIFSEKGIMISIVTSGYIMNKRILSSLIENKTNISTIQVSIDGLEETHNEIRQKNNSFQNAIKFIKTLNENNFPLDVASSIINQDKEEIFSLSQLLKDLGIKRHRLGMVMNTGRSDKNNLEIRTPDTVSKWTREFNEKIGSQTFQVVEDEEFEDEGLELSKKGKVCGAGYQLLRVSPYLVVYPCPIFDVPIFNLKENSLLNYCKENSMKFYEMSVPKKEICHDCALLDICNQCPAQAMIEHGKVSNCHWMSKEKSLITSIEM